MAQHDHVSLQLHSLGTPIRAQYHGFGTSPGSDLRLYPSAYIETKERAFAANSERCIEGEHVKIKTAQQRCLRYAKTAYVGRGNGSHRCVQCWTTPPKKEWVIQQWARRALIPELTSLIAPQSVVLRLTLAQRHANIYGYE